jgi:hypothetical protein
LHALCVGMEVAPDMVRTKLLPPGLFILHAAFITRRFKFEVQLPVTC